MVKGCDGKYRVWAKMQYENVLGTADQGWFIKGVQEMVWVPIGSHDTIDSAHEQIMLLKEQEHPPAASPA